MEVKKELKRKRSPIKIIQTRRKNREEKKIIRQNKSMISPPDIGCSMNGQHCPLGKFLSMDSVVCSLHGSLVDGNSSGRQQYAYFGQPIREWHEMHAATASNFVKQRHRTQKIFLKTNAHKMFILHTLLLRKSIPKSSIIFKVSSQQLRHIRKNYLRK